MQTPLRAEDLPLWMKPRPRQIDIAPLAVLLVCLALALPLITHAGLPASPSARSEAARIMTMENSLQAGILYPRWAQQFHYGYGSPLPNYLAPMPYYAGGMTMLFTQADAVISLKILLVGAIFLAGFGMFFAVRRLSGTLPAFIAALVYVLAPTTVYRLALTDINLPFLMAAALFPWVMWAADRLLHSGDGRDVLFFGLAVAFLLMTSNLMGPLLLVMAALWLMWRFFTLPDRRASLPLVFAGLTLGIGLAAIYWLPALLEWRDVHWLPVVNVRDSLSLLDVIRPVGAADIHLLNVPQVKTPGLAALILGVAGLFGRRYRPFAVMGLLLIVAALVPNHWLDDAARFPPLTRSDLLLPLTACCALLAASAVEKIRGHVWLWTGLIALGTLAAAYPILQVPPFISLDATPEGYLQAEINGSISGSFRDGQLLPVQTDALPEPSPDAAITRIEQTQHLPRSNLAMLLHDPTRDQVRVNLPGTLDLDVLTLYFPGWRARYQGGKIPLERAPETGLMRVEVPAGVGILDIHFGLTPARIAGMIVSLVSLILLIIVVVIVRTPAAVPPLISREEQQNNAMAVILGGLVFLLILAGRAVPPQPNALARMTAQPISFASDVRVQGFNLSQEGDTLHLRVFLQAIGTDIPNYSLRAATINTEDGQTVDESQFIAPGGWFSSEWPPDRVIQQDISLTVPPRATLETYQIVLQMIGCESQSNIGACEAPFALLSFDARGRPLGNAPVISIR